MIDWLQTVQDYGAGEIVLTFVDTEGTGKGFDLDILNKISNRVKVPFIVHGGAGCEKDILKVSRVNSVNGVCISSIFHYDLVKKYKKVPNIVYGNKEFLKKFNKKLSIKTISAYNLKKFLKKNGIEVRCEKN